jgi:hypothetical protein
MTHVNLDAIEGPVRDLLLAACRDPSGSVLELDGQPIAWLIPAIPQSGHGEEPWTDLKNERRCRLIDRKSATGLTEAETVELALLQAEMLRHRQRVASLP